MLKPFITINSKRKKKIKCDPVERKKKQNKQTKTIFKPCFTM